jgi:hypothetical protein
VVADVAVEPGEGAGVDEVHQIEPLGERAAQAFDDG